MERYIRQTQNLVLCYYLLRIFMCFALWICTIIFCENNTKVLFIDKQQWTMSLHLVELLVIETLVMHCHLWYSGMLLPYLNIINIVHSLLYVFSICFHLALALIFTHLASHFCTKSTWICWRIWKNFINMPW